MTTGVELATAWVRLVPTVEGVQGTLAKELNPAAEKAGNDAGKKAGSKFGAGMKAAMTVASAAIVAGVVKVFDTGLEELKFGEKVSAQTDQLIKNTGFKMKTAEIEDFTLALSKLSGVSEEELQQAGNSLIRFGDLSEENYKKAVASINDMAASGKDAAGTGEMLGKALADPAKAATLLKRSGVLLNEEQKALIKNLTETGDKAGAQAVILDALEGTYGGMAEKAGGTLEGQLNKLNNTWENVAGSMVELVMPAIQGILGVLTPLIGMLEDNPAVASAVAIGLGVLAAAFVAVTVATWAMNTALLANPITWIVLGITALVAALIWVATQTTFFQDVWEGVMTVIGAVWDWLWTNVIKPVADAIGKALKVLGEVFEWIWSFIIKPIVDLIVNYFRFWGAVAVWLYENAIKPMFKAIGDIINWVWLNVIKPVVDFIAKALRTLGDVFNWLYLNIVKPVWDNISAAMKAAWNWINAYVFTPFKIGIDLIGQAFENVAKAIGTAWDGIKKAAAVPINFVLDTVWNKGLRSFWNDMVTNLGLKDMKLPAAKLVKFANGGVENHTAQIARAGAMRLWAEPETGGEAYIPLAPSKRARSSAILGEVARRFGYGLTAYKDGGFFDTAGSFAGDVWDNITGVASVIGDFFANPVAAVQKHVIDGIINPLLGGAGDSIFAKTVGSLPAMVVKNLAKMLNPPSRGTKGMGWQAMWDIVKSAVPGVRKTSDFRPGATVAGSGSRSYHALGRAIDLVPASMDTFNAVARLFPNASELIYSPAGSRQLLNGKSFNGWSDTVRRMHYNHVHLALANGGILPGLQGGGTVLSPGRVLVGERGPEVLTLPRGAQVSPDYDPVDDGGVTFNNYAPIGQSPEQALSQFANRAKGL